MLMINALQQQDNPIFEALRSECSTAVGEGLSAADPRFLLAPPPSFADNASNDHWPQKRPAVHRGQETCETETPQQRDGTMRRQGNRPIGFRAVALYSEG